MGISFACIRTSETTTTKYREYNRILALAVEKKFQRSITDATLVTAYRIMHFDVQGPFSFRINLRVTHCGCMNSCYCVAIAIP